MNAITFFTKGDRLKCVDNRRNNLLEVGKRYTFSKYCNKYGSERPMIYLEEFEEGIYTTFYAHRFIAVDPELNNNVLIL